MCLVIIPVGLNALSEFICITDARRVPYYVGQYLNARDMGALLISKFSRKPPPNTVLRVRFLSNDYVAPSPRRAIWTLHLHKPSAGVFLRTAAADADGQRYSCAGDVVRVSSLDRDPHTS
ncbi:hypothetical protein EVAR_29544_1 [Eumeta japonica]|uniref:Uncharacterized protein n=1 Tax=Eumeta variegata TaxID=151549 RepID=A0A4C1WFK8_EUMVA|nr:hypothetical protein EVAR_29544_1 [Eumeta japonica]